MPYKIKAQCPLCGEETRELSQPHTQICSVCRNSYEAYSDCQNKHFVCNMCRQKAVREKIIRHCMKSAKENPFELQRDLMQIPGVLMHGPEHHLLTTAALLTAYANKKNRRDLEKLLHEADRRTIQVPGAACGFWGVCGAAVGAGVFISILTETGPLSTDTWRTTGQLTAKCADVISAQGGPRCCKRDSFLSLRETLQYSNEILDAGFDVPKKIICEFYVNNRECKGRACEFFPLTQRNTQTADPVDTETE